VFCSAKVRITRSSSTRLGGAYRQYLVTGKSTITSLARSVATFRFRNRKAGRRTIACTGAGAAELIGSYQGRRAGPVMRDVRQLPP
jgi:hypothetical protein